MDFSYAIVEQLGHRRFVGRVQEESVAGATMLRIEPVVDDEPFTGTIRYRSPIYLGGASLFAVTPTTEEELRAELQRSHERRERDRLERERWRRERALPAGKPDEGEPSDPLDPGEEE